MNYGNFLDLALSRTVARLSSGPSSAVVSGAVSSALISMLLSLSSRVRHLRFTTGPSRGGHYDKGAGLSHVTIEVVARSGTRYRQLI